MTGREETVPKSRKVFCCSSTSPITPTKPKIMGTTPILLFIFFTLVDISTVLPLQILSKSKLEKCERTSGGNDSLECTRKIVLNLAVPSGSSGGEASLVAEIVEVEENTTSKMQTLRVPPVVTITKSAAYALYDLTYIRDVPYKPQEYYVKTRKCEPEADKGVVEICERLRDADGHIIEHTQPVCCPCGPERRVPSSCGNVFDRLTKGKPNTAHCLRFPGDWFNVFGIGQRSIGFSVRIEVKAGNRVSDLIVGPDNRTATSNDKLLRVNLVGDFVGYTNIPSFEDFYLVIPRQGGQGQPPALGTNFSMWMLLERVRFTLDGIECNKIGVDFGAFNGQPDFCSSPYGSCLHNQLWNFWDADRNRIERNQLPLYGVERRFERINQHPNAGTHSFSIGVTEVLNTNLLIELTADDIEYVYQRSPGKILSVAVPTFETLSQFGVASVTTKNIGGLEASYSLTFQCMSGVSLTEEQFFIMKPNEVVTRSFKLYPTTDQAAKYLCAAILKDSDFIEVDRADCQFSTTATIIDNGSQIPFQPPKSGVKGFFESIKIIWTKFWQRVVDFVTGKSCRGKCLGFFDLVCHFQYMCISWLLLFGLLLATIPTAVVLLWLLHQKGLFDPICDWCDDHLQEESQYGARRPHHRSHMHDTRRHHHHKDMRHLTHHSLSKRRTAHHRHKHLDRNTDFYYYLHHVNKDRTKHVHAKHSRNVWHSARDSLEDNVDRHHQGRRKDREFSEVLGNGENRQFDTRLTAHPKRRD